MATTFYAMEYQKDRSYLPGDELLGRLGYYNSGKQCEAAPVETAWELIRITLRPKSDGTALRSLHDEEEL